MSYSVIIRTLRGGGKYQLLLESINKQTVKPEHVYIVLPHGYDPPKERLGYEEFVYTDKGMWEQRIFGMEFCFGQLEHSKYLLVCDDDVSFDEDFMKRLLDIAEEFQIDTLVPIKDSRNSKLKNFISRLFGERTENRTSPYKISIKSNGRFSVNNDLRENVNPCQSGPFQCFLMRTDVTPDLRLREEMWLDETRYAWPDDQVFFYKAYLQGLRTYSCKTPEFKHLDGKSGVPNRQRQLDAIYSQSRNIIIFWNRFILSHPNSKHNKTVAKVSFKYYLFINKLRLFVSGALKRDLSLYKNYRRGIKDGFAKIDDLKVTCNF